VIDSDPTEQLKAVASQVLSGDQLAAFLAVADAKKLADASGNIDAEKVGADLRTLYGIAEQPQTPPRNWGQGTGYEVGQPAGASARAALAKRHGVKGADTPAAGQGIRPGATARAALAKRHTGGKR
jgi:hypothetical protein